MLTVEENERLTRIGPGTSMGKYMRRFWWPLCLSTELPERDGAPLRVRILGEDLIAFTHDSYRPSCFFCAQNSSHFRRPDSRRRTKCATDKGRLYFHIQFFQVEQLRNFPLGHFYCL